jgi:HSP20 family protein
MFFVNLERNAWRIRKMALSTRKEGALTPFRKEMERFFDELAAGRWPSWQEERESFFPAVEAGETDDEFFVKAQVPGMKKENVEVELSDGSLTIKGEAKEDEEERRKSYYRREFAYGSFARRIPLPSGADTSRAKAELHEGVLSVHIPKTEESKKRSVKLAIG